MCLLRVALNVAQFGPLRRSTLLRGREIRTGRRHLTGCSFDYLSNDFTSKIFILTFFLGAWMVPMVIILYSYLSIIRYVALSRRSVTHMDGIGTTHYYIKTFNIVYTLHTVLLLYMK